MPVDVVGLATSVDKDDDGCTDGQENGLNEASGGRRNYLNFWDFFDALAGNPLARDRRITIADITALVPRFGSVGDAQHRPVLGATCCAGVSSGVRPHAADRR